MVLTSGAAVLLEDVARYALMLAEDGAAALVAEAGHHLGVADKVGEEDGDEARASKRLRSYLLAGNMRRFGPNVDKFADAACDPLRIVGPAPLYHRELCIGHAGGEIFRHLHRRVLKPAVL